MEPPPNKGKRFPLKSSSQTPISLIGLLRGIGITVVFAVGLFALWQKDQNINIRFASIDTEIFPSWATISLIIVAIASNMVFVASETAIECLHPIHLKMLKEGENEWASKNLQKLIDRRSSYFAATIIGSQSSRFAIVLLSILLAPAFLPLNSVASLSSLLLVTIAISLPLLILNMILELVPRSYATLHPCKIGLRLFSFIEIASLIFSLPALAVTSVAGLLTARFGAKASFGVPNQAEEDIKIIVESAQESGEIEQEEKEMLHSVFEFSDTVVREVMTPRVDIDGMPVNSTPDSVISLMHESGHSRIPLYEDTDDAIVGIIHAKDLLMEMLSDKSVSLKSLMRQPMFVPENKNLHDLLREMRVSRSQMAVVQDEFGGTSGIVTIEDIVEEVVGDIIDEYDVEEPNLVQIGDGWLIDAKTHVDDVKRALNITFDTEEFDTIGGYVFGLFGRQPQQGESIEDAGIRYTIAETDGRRVQRLRVDKLATSETTQAKP